MSRPIVSAAADVTLGQLAELLSDHRVGAVPVVDDDGRAVGMVTEADLARGADRGESAVAAADVMSAPAVTVQALDSAFDALRKMRRFHVGRLPVLDGAGRVVGMVSGSDLSGTRPPEPSRDAGVRRDVTDRVIDAGGEVLALDIDEGVVRLRIRLGTCAEIPVVEHMLRDVPGVTRLELAVDSVGGAPGRAPGDDASGASGDRASGDAALHGDRRG